MRHYGADTHALADGGANLLPKGREKGMKGCGLRRGAIYSGVMKQTLRWTVFLTVLVFAIALLSLMASPALRNRTWFELDRVWPHHGGPGLPVFLGRVLRPTVPVWVQVEPHMNMRLDPVDDVDRNILIDGEWERETWHGLYEHVPRGGVFVDVGAHIGYYSLKAASMVGPGGRVLAIEPNPDTVRRLRANIRASGASNVTVAPVACSDSEGVLELFAAAHINTGASSLSEANASHFGPVTAAYRVQGRRLDGIVQESGVTRVDVIKIDVEGAEFMVLKGAAETLDRYHPVVVIEIIEGQLRAMGTSSADVLRFFRAHGYALRHTYAADENSEFAFTPGR